MNSSTCSKSPVDLQVMVKLSQVYSVVEVLLGVESVVVPHVVILPLVLVVVSLVAVAGTLVLHVHVLHVLAG
jgi:hypothetical protein